MNKKKILLIVLILALAELFQCRSYTAAATCGDCVKLTTCSDNKCVFLHGEKFHNQELICYFDQVNTCSQYYYPFMAYECQACQNSCCIRSPGQPDSCIDPIFAQILCVFDDQIRIKNLKEINEE